MKFLMTYALKTNIQFSVFRVMCNIEWSTEKKKSLQCIWQIEKRKNNSKRITHCLLVYFINEPKNRFDTIYSYLFNIWKN